MIVLSAVSITSMAAGEWAWPTSRIRGILAEKFKDQFAVNEVNQTVINLVWLENKHSIRLERSTTASRFFIDGRVLDTKSIHSMSELEKSVRDLLGAKSHAGFWALPIAHAEENFDQKLKRASESYVVAVTAILAEMKNIQRCEPFFKFGNQCQDYVDSLESLKQRTKTSLLRTQTGGTLESRLAAQIPLQQNLLKLEENLRDRADDFLDDIGRPMKRTTGIDHCICQNDTQAQSPTCKNNSLAENPAWMDLLACLQGLQRLRDSPELANAGNTLQHLQDVLTMIRKGSPSDDAPPPSPSGRP